MAEMKRKPRYWYEYAGEKFQVPEHFVYRIHESKGGGADINEAFFTWAFNKHNISIVDIDIIYASDDRTPKKPKDQVAASSTFFIAKVRGKDKRGIEKVGDGESGNESITNFQRGFPAGLAIKRAKVNMGKEFFNLVDLKYAIDCRDAEVDFGQDKGKSLETLAQTPQGVNTLRWFASEKFNGDDMFKMKVAEFISLYVDKTGANPSSTGGGSITSTPNQNQYRTGSSSTQSGSTTTVTNNTQGTNSNPVANSSTPITKEQFEVLGNYRKFKFLTDQQVSTIATELFGQGFSWKTATHEQGAKFIARLEQLYGKL